MLAVRTAFPFAEQSRVIRCLPMSAAPDDTRLMEAVAAGDRQALAQLYDRHGPVLLALGMRFLGSRAEAEDVLHDVFLEVWKRAHTFDPARASLRTWLAVRMRSRALDRLKSAGVSRRQPLAAAPERAEEPRGAMTYDSVRLPGWLATLPEAQREVILLGYFEGLSCSEMAGRLAIPIGTVKSRLASAMRNLRDTVGVEVTR